MILHLLIVIRIVGEEFVRGRLTTTQQGTCPMQEFNSFLGDDDNEGRR